MKCPRRFAPWFIALAGIVLAGSAFGQITVTGVSDKATYADTVTFSVGIQSGYAYGATLNGRPAPVGVPVTVNAPDFYELNVYATNVFTSALTERLIRFLVHASERVGTEWGLPPHVPLPLVPSAPAELAGARLKLIAPSAIPAGFEIPIVAWVLDDAGRAVRGNGVLSAAGQRSFGIKRGVGSGFLASTNPVGTLSYEPSLAGVATNKAIVIEPAPSWNVVGGVLNGQTVWPDGARIRVTSHLTVPAGSSLTIDAGAIVLLNPGMNITNNGTITVNGTVERPVVFMPVSRSQPWGGFFMRNSSGVFDATGTILTGSGADPTGGAGHRREQCLFLVDNQPRVSMTDSAAIYLSGQFGHAYGGGTFRFDRFLLQRATTGGEYTGASFTVNDSAFIEFPDDSANFVDGDNDALYFVSGSHAFANTLIGWTKDDGIDSGGSGFGTLTYQSCWFESTFHEGNSLSGYKSVLSRDTVYIDCGQGIENGYDGPTNRMEHCLFLGNKTGVRHGDNYPSIGNYDGRETVVNSLSLFNHRDVFGFNWRSGGWTNATGQMSISGNWLSAPNAYFPNNALYDGAGDAHRLAPFLTTRTGAPVGAGLAVRTNSLALSSLAQGVPVRLSSFTTNPVSVSYVFESPATGPVGAGALTFVPGQTVQRIYPAGFDVAGQPAWTLRLTTAAGAELTGVSEVTLSGSVPAPSVAFAVSGTSLPGYRIAEGTFVRLNGATAQPVSVDYALIGDGIRIGGGILAFNPPVNQLRILPDGLNPFAYAALEVVLSNPVGGAISGPASVTYVNPIVSVAFGVATNQLDLAVLQNGLPVSLNSPAPGPVSVGFSIEGAAGVLTNGQVTIAQGEATRLLVVPTINVGTETFLRAKLSGPTGAALGSPSIVYLVRVDVVTTPTNLIPRGSVWRYRDLASAAPAGWQNPGFDDGTWPSGPAQLGFSGGEERDEVTLVADNDQITSYFRHSFNVTDPAAYQGLSFWLLRDDGGVVYLNGTEIFRTPNLPASPTVINYNTTTAAPNGENTIDTGTTSRSALRQGANVLAVEIHQQSATSSDLSFDFELIGIPAPLPPLPPQLHLATFDARMTIAWGAPGFVLEQATELLPANTVWAEIGTTSPVVINTALPRGFFRLRQR